MKKLYKALDRALTLARPHGGQSVWTLMLWLAVVTSARILAYTYTNISYPT